MVARLTSTHSVYMSLSQLTFSSGSSLDQMIIGSSCTMSERAPRVVQVVGVRGLSLSCRDIKAGF